MAGPRKAEYVSLPIGPGVLSNPTGRAAHTRIAFQNWDRWVDSSWVRWHKLLPEKRGGWQYQNLVAANPQAVPDSPILLVTFDGAQGQGTFSDSSILGNTITNNGTGGGVTVDTAAPKVGVGAGKWVLANESFLSVPTVVNGALDIDTGDFCVEFWCKPGIYGTISLQSQLWTYENNSFSSGIRLQITGNSPNGNWVAQSLGGAVGSLSIQYNPAVAVATPGVWAHVALVRYGTTLTLYINGVGQAYTAPISTSASFGAAGNPMMFGADALTGIQKNWFDGEIDNWVVWPYAKYTQNFTPGTTPTPSGILPGTYLGTARALHDWSSLDTQFWVAVGTHLKVYLDNGGTLYDITPSRKSSNLLNSITTANGSAVVTIVDNDHRANDGDYITIIGSVAVGGLLLDGEYPVTVIDPNSYTITAAAPATATQTGGGNFTIRYDIYTGLESNGLLHGYGTGPYGEYTYGTPRPAGVGIMARLRTWSIDNFGEDLILSPSDGGIYWWQRPYGPGSIATIIPNAPDGCQRVMIDKQREGLVALGCTDITGTYNPLLVRWTTVGDITGWIPTDTNDAGDKVLTAGSRLVTGLGTKSQNLVWTDTAIFRMAYSQSNVYDLIPAGDCSIVGPNAAVDVDGVAMFMAFDNLYTYDGTLQVLSCEVWETVFSKKLSTSLLRSQSEKVFCYTDEEFTEVTWIYPSIGGNGECDRYVTYNWDDQVWYYGAWNRTCAQGRAAAMDGYPYSAAGGYLYQDELGTDAVEASGTTALGFYLRSLDITTGGRQTPQTMGGSDSRFLVGGSDSHLRVVSMIPDFAYFTGAMNLTLKSKDRPQEANYVVSGPVAFAPTSTQVDISAHGSQLVIELDNLTVPADPSAAEVSLLLHMDGANGSTTFTDSSSYANVMTAAGAAALVTSGEKFGSACGAFNGTNAIVTTPIAVGGVLDLSSSGQPWTVEGWIKPAVIANGIFFCLGSAPGGDGFYIQAIQITNQVAATIFTAGGIHGINTGANVAPVGSWSHVALVFDGSSYALYLNGVPGTTGAGFGVIKTPTAGLQIGGAAGGVFFNGDLDEFRVTNGVARYTGPFTPPAAPFPDPGAPYLPALGTSFRMGVWQGLAVPYGKR